MPDLRKQKIVSDLIQRLSIMKGYVITEYKGLNVYDMNIIREQLRLVNSQYIVVKNSLLKLSFKKLNININNTILTGPIAIIINNNNDVISVAKLIMKFTNMYKVFKFKTAFLDGMYMDKEAMKQISSIISKEVLVNSVLNSLKIPIMHFICILTNNLNKLIVILKKLTN
jgi:large subunit ribosomal protein L10